MMDVFAGLVQATRCCRQDTAFCGGVTFHQYIIMDAVANRGGMRISDLRDLLAVEKSTTTRLVTPLIAKGLLSKAPSVSDSRIFMLSLTKKGRKTHLDVQACLADFFNKIEQNLPQGRQDEILQSVNIFIEAIKNAAGACTCCV